NGNQIKPLLSKEVRRLGARASERTMITRIRKKNGKVIGAFGFNIDDGQFYAFLSRATVLATGESWRLFSNNAARNPYSTWHSPYNTGSGPALALMAGAKIIDLELCKSTLHPKGFGAPGMAAFTGFGAYLVNKNQERYMLRYSPKGEKAPRPLLVRHTLMEIEEGRGPIYVDCRHLSETEIELMKHLLISDMLSYRYFFEDRKINLKEEMLEVEVGCLLTGGGLFIDEECSTTVSGLFGAGDCAMSSDGGLGQAFTVGFVAGENAAKYAKREENGIVITLEEIQSAYDDCFSFLNRKGGPNPGDVEAKIQLIMNDYVGFHRTESTISEGMKKLDSLEPEVDRMKAGDLHELLRAHEVRHMYLVARMVANGAFHRKESRSFHFRDDFPETLPTWDFHLAQELLDDGKLNISRIVRS
ncbi:MAG: FAD-binding protein, partial [Nitrososphaerota archaeon]|nr:FAD-binding protein [Nitrososphaerota archaeon]